MAFENSQKYIRLGAIGAVAIAGAVSFFRPSPLQPDPDLALLARQAGFLKSNQAAPAEPRAAERPGTIAVAQAAGPEEGAAVPQPQPAVTRGSARPATVPVLAAALPEPGDLPRVELALASVAEAVPETRHAPAPLPEAEPPVAPEPVAVVADPPAQAGAAGACSASMKIIAVPGGLAYFLVEAPCRPAGPVQVSHAGLAVTLDMSASLRLSTTIPVLDADEPFRAELADGTVIEKSLETVSASAFEHVVLQWEGDTGLQLHALEAGADYGSSGHVWAGAPKEVLRGVRGEGGFLTRLGTPGLGGVAEVYSYPVEAMIGADAVAVTVEAEVTESNCGKDISGEILQRDIDGKITSAQLVFAVPDCDAVGDILVLKNILQDLKIAAN